MRSEVTPGVSEGPGGFGGAKAGDSSDHPIPDPSLASGDMHDRPWTVMLVSDDLHDRPRMVDNRPRIVEEGDDDWRNRESGVTSLIDAVTDLPRRVNGGLASLS